MVLVPCGSGWWFRFGGVPWLVFGFVLGCWVCGWSCCFGGLSVISSLWILRGLWYALLYAVFVGFCFSSMRWFRSGFFMCFCLGFGVVPLRVLLCGCVSCDFLVLG